MLTENDDGGGNLNSRVTFTPQSGINYIVRATTFDPPDSVTYNLSVSSATNNIALRNPPSFQTGTQVSLSSFLDSRDVIQSPVPGVPNIQQEVIPLSATPNLPVTVTLTSATAGYSPQLAILNQNDQVIVQNGDSSSTSVNFTPLAGESYRIAVGNFGTVLNLAQYDLSVSTQPGGNVNLQLNSENPQQSQVTQPPSQSTVPVRRIFDLVTGSHVYTTDPTEIAQLTAATARYRDEGNVFDSAGPNRVTRFLNTVTEALFYSINASEVETVRRTFGFVEQPSGGFDAAIAPAAGLVPVFRFYNTVTGRHFFTPNTSEAANVRNNLPGFRDEGIGFYADPLG